MKQLAEQIINKAMFWKVGGNEQGAKNVVVEVVDEKSATYPFGRANQLSSYIPNSSVGMGFGTSSNSRESFGENGQKEVGAKVTELIDPEAMKAGTLDVGCGTNIFVGEGAATASGSQTILLDFLDDKISRPDLSTHRPPQFWKNEENGLPRFLGNFADIDDWRSKLRKQKFGMVMFNGSWSSGGNNYTASRLVEAEYHSGEKRKDNNEIDRQAFQQKGLEQLLEKAKNHLVDGGAVYISSSRFALHGDGFGFDQLANEKLQFLNATDVLISLRAKKITVIGASSEGITTWVENNMIDPEVRLTRFTETFFEIFHGYAMGPKRHLIVKGVQPTPLEITQMCEDREQMRELMETPGTFRDQMMAEVELRETRIREVGQCLTEGVEAIPDDVGFSYTTSDRALELKSKLKDKIPKSLARIDAIIAEF